MNNFIYQKPVWAHDNWSLSPAGIVFNYNSPILLVPLDLKFFYESFSRLLPKVQRQIILDFGDEDKILGE